MGGYVYILISLKDYKQYIGSSKNVSRRILDHNAGRVRSTRHRTPFKLKYTLTYENIELAATMERRFKRSHDSLLRELKKQMIVIDG